MGRSFSLVVATQKLRQQLVGLEFPSRGSSPDLFSRRGAARDIASSPPPRSVLDHMRTFASALEEFHECIQDFQEYDDGMIYLKGALQALCSDIKVSPTQ
jgi:hypothetical protein